MRWIVVIFGMLCSLSELAFAQDKAMVQIKTFDHQLKPMVHQEIALNGKTNVTIGNKGSVFVEVPVSDLPPRSITIKNEELEAESWNYSKGVLEIIIRKKSYRVTHWSAVDNMQQPVPNIRIQFTGRRHQSVTSDANGKFDLRLALDEVSNVNNFAADGYVIVDASSDVLKVQPIVVAEAKTSQQKPKPNAIPKDYFKNFDFSMLDSIQSLTMFYAVFRNYQIKDFSAEQKKRIDYKFNQLVKQLQDSLKRSDMFIGKISRSSFVRDDFQNLLAQAEEERQMLENQRADFDEKIKLLTEKLESGVENMDDGTRNRLISDIGVLEKLLLENENQFYRNQSDYRNIISSLKEKYFDLENLENKLSESELKRVEEQRVFRQRLIAILCIVGVFAFLIILLIRFSNRLRKQKMQLEEANGEIKRMNENLEILVYVRTKLLAEAHKELDTFLYRASHDLRSPVCSIIGLCNIASSQLPNGESKELIDRVVRTTENMDKLLKKLSLISEINQPSNYSEINLRDSIEAIGQRFKNFIREQRILFSINCDENVNLNSYPNLVTAILTNTIENALYYSSLANKKGATVEVDAVREGERVKITVSDNGIGLEESIKPRIFDMFYKGHYQSKGNGLGLYIVHKSLQALEGEIIVDSVVGEYTKFILYLPSNVAPVTPVYAEAMHEMV